MEDHHLQIRILLCVVAVTIVCAVSASYSELIAQQKDAEPTLQTEPSPSDEKIAAVITCHDMIDQGLYESIKRRGSEAIAAGAEYLFLEVETYGGLVKSADDISKYLIQDLPKDIHTVAYVKTEAISAGSMISVSCKDIIMRQNTTIGCSAPIVSTGAEMGQAEREKMESFVRATFSRAAQANGYPEALLKAMVSQNIEVWQVKNKQTGQLAYFEKEFLPTDPNAFDIANKKLIVKEGELLTLTDQEAMKYGIARAVVANFDEAIEFLEKRDGVAISGNILRLETMWSEELVRWLTSPVVASILVLGILLGVYVEFHTPGLGLPSLLAVACLVILVGSKYLTGMANWIEIAVLVLGIILLLLEIFVIPGFGIAGIAGIVCIMAGLFGMLIKNAPDELPWPQSNEAWTLFVQGVLGIIGGIAGFTIIAWLLAKYMPRIGFLSGLILNSPAYSNNLITSSKTIIPGNRGVVVTPLRPAGSARINGKLYDVTCQAEFIEKDQFIEVVKVSGNRIVVKKTEEKN